MNVSLSSKALAALDRYRGERKIRSRAKALETVLLEAVPDDSVRLSASERKLLDSRIAEAKAGHTVAASVVWEELQARKRRLSES